MVWVDVEPVPDFEWSGDTVANAAVVEGAARGYADAGYRVGVYSTPYLWEGVVGDLALGLPEWRAAGETSRAEALEPVRPGLVDPGRPGGAGPVGRAGGATRTSPAPASRPTSAAGSSSTDRRVTTGQLTRLM